MGWWPSYGGREGAIDRTLYRDAGLVFTLCGFLPSKTPSMWKWPCGIVCILNFVPVEMTLEALDRYEIVS